MKFGYFFTAAAAFAGGFATASLLLPGWLPTVGVEPPAIAANALIAPSPASALELPEVIVDAPSAEAVPARAAEGATLAAEARVNRVAMNSAASAIESDVHRAGTAPALANSARIGEPASGSRAGATPYELIAQQEYGARCATAKGICKLAVPQPVGSTCTCGKDANAVKGTTVR
jgi:hypothetical protein